ncbi:hypothetical protein HTZ84_22095 [Haloterrigena sp. SYSU A558-1]|uniref:Uncharacterized protein n=1 Tax=Haloterrigena gelatinilytica TaxID=2741724 RepID=A0ABX2LIH1_9EURY|nr:hypothetical protein [Haloterrigena gelatinilytica]NUC74959.1 hypothetical protein [Haloterrigena gelatinilytica]
MQTKTADADKRTADNPITRERSYHAVPADWVRMGHDEHRLEDRSRFYADKACYEYVLARDPAAVGNIAERHRLHVAYRKPGSTEAVERVYEASVVETTADALEVSTSAVDGDRGPEGWGTIAFEALAPDANTAVIPKCVYDGEPRNFRASVAVRPSEPRIGGER